MNFSRLILAILLGCTVLFAQGQDAPLPEAAVQALEEGRDAMREALATYDAQYPDRPLWQEAFRHGRRAQSLAPDSSEPTRFLAEAYSRANWFGPAWNTWIEYLDRGNLLDADATPLFTEVGAQQGFNFYRQGRLEDAADVYRRIIDEVPFDLEAHTWMGRLMIEMDRPEAAISYWQTVVDRNPGDERAQYFLDLAREQAEWGTEAVNAFREGVAFYEDGAAEQARERFARATSLNPEYPAAWAWLGRVAFEAENYGDARTYYGRATALEPGNEAYDYFYEEAGRRTGAEQPGAAADRPDAAAGRPDGADREAPELPTPPARPSDDGRGEGAGPPN